VHVAGLHLLVADGLLVLVAGGLLLALGGAPLGGGLRSMPRDSPLRGVLGSNDAALRHRSGAEL
jgi:hypothetical protein